VASKYRRPSFVTSPYRPRCPRSVFESVLGRKTKIFDFSEFILHVNTVPPCPRLRSNRPNHHSPNLPTRTTRTFLLRYVTSPLSRSPSARLVVAFRVPVSAPNCGRNNPAARQINNDPRFGTRYFFVRALTISIVSVATYFQTIFRALF